MTRSLLRFAAPIFTLALAGFSPAGAQFANETVPAGLTWAQVTWGAALSDLDLDGDLDIYSGHHFYAPILYWNDGTGVFDRFLHPAPWVGDTDRHGSLIVSLDEDALPELFVTHGADAGSGSEKDQLYRNAGGGSFVFQASAGGMADLDGRGRSIAAADADGDGRLDVWVGKAADLLSPNSLYRNEGGLTFTDMAAPVGLAEVVGTSGGVFGDIDGDGDPDLLAGGEEFARPTTVFRNDAGTFTDASAIFSPSLPVISGADFADFDEDGDLDLAVVDGEVAIFDAWSEGDSLSFYFNMRWGDTGIDGMTIPATAETALATVRVRGLFDPTKTFLGPAQTNPGIFPPIVLTDEYVGEPSFTPGVDRGIWIWRTAPGGAWEIRCSTPNLGFDSFDGHLSDGVPIAGSVAHELESYDFTPGGPRVWRNDGETFVEVTQDWALPLMVNPMDVSWVDYDNDADLDLHVVDSGTSANPNAPDGLFRNDGTSFTDVTSFEGIAGASIAWGDGGVWGDLDGDLDLDLYLQEGGGPFALSQYGPSTLYRNEGDRGGALLVDLLNATGGPAVGAAATMHVGARAIHRTVNASAWRGFQDPTQLHFGLAGESGCDSLAIRWRSGTVEVFGPLAAGRWTLAEGTSPVAAPIPTAIPVASWRIAALFPQPATGMQTLVVEVTRSVDLDVALFDVRGRRVATWHRGVLAAGSHRIVAKDVLRLPAGMYFVRATDGARTTAERALRLR